MGKNLFEIKYFETYYFANIVNNILREPFLYLRSLNDFLGDENYKNFLSPFPKKSALHEFIVFIIDSINYDDLNEYENESFIKGNRKLWVEIALESYKFEFDTFEKFLKEKEKSREIINDEFQNIFNFLDFMSPTRIY